MEMDRKNSLSGEDKFSFPVITESTLESDDQFEFGSHVPTPGSPNSPADHLFYNGKLLPHVFPTQTCSNNFSYSRSTSRTSSKGSSFVSSRSNSTNSTRSSSARTSTSDRDQRKASNVQNCVRKDRHYKPVLSKPCKHSSSQRWQLIMATPALKHQGSGSRKAKDVMNQKGSKKSFENEVEGSERCWFVKKLLRAFVSACNRCHALDEASGVVMVEL